ncbi:glycoside hydrolase/deacetylase [Marasmius fiardii PR-910]|nr:glycoside hydrolase/deacetylase [Marasmius fiardii PR-910]
MLSVVSAIDRTTVEEQSAISGEWSPSIFTNLLKFAFRAPDPVEQCTIYNFPPIADEIPKFPQVFTKATILENDEVAKAKFAEISSKIPDIPPKGSIATYDAKADPDCWWTATLCTKSKREGIVADISSVPEPETLGVVFDDGPNCSHNAFYDHLVAQKQKATMFFIGSNVLAWPLQAKRAMDDGHEICVHTWSHPPMTTLSNEDAFAEIYYTIKLLTGATPTCFRPPQGDIDDRIRAISTALGLTNVLWEFDTNDTVPGPSGVVEKETVQANYKKFIETAQSGKFKEARAILLAHETNNLTMQLAIDFYPQLKAAFKHLVPIAVAYNKTQPYVEKDFVFPDFAKCAGTTRTNKTSSSSTQSGVSSASTPSGSSSASTRSGALSAPQPCGTSSTATAIASTSRASISTSVASPASSFPPSSPAASASVSAVSSGAGSNSSHVVPPPASGTPTASASVGAASPSNNNNSNSNSNSGAATPMTVSGSASVAPQATPAGAAVGGVASPNNGAGSSVSVRLSVIGLGVASFVPVMVHRLLF